jgi:hypothetical protein
VVASEEGAVRIAAATPRTREVRPPRIAEEWEMVAVFIIFGWMTSVDVGGRSAA